MKKTYEMRYTNYYFSSLHCQFYECLWMMNEIDEPAPPSPISGPAHISK